MAQIFTDMGRILDSCLQKCYNTNDKMQNVLICPSCGQKQPFAFSALQNDNTMIQKGVFCIMIRIDNRYGSIEISQEYFRYLVGNAVSSCYGVVGMVRNGPRQGLRSILSRRAYMDDGVRVRNEGDNLIVDVHIQVIFGMNISAIAKSIVHKVRYTVEEATGLTVKKVNVYVDGIQPE